MTKVLVTAGSGFIASHCIRQLLERGYTVVTTVRSPEKGNKVLDAHSKIAENKLSYQVVKDVAQKGAFDEVIKSTPDLEFVMHTASPFHYNVQDPVKDFLEPAVTGTTSILDAIRNDGPTVKRVVLLSSMAAMRDNTKSQPPFYDESTWNPVTWDEAVQDTKKTYQGSKTLAERAAWDFVKKEKPSFDLVTINPALVFGPVAPHLSSQELDGLNTSNMRILDMMQGKMKDKLKPTGFYTYADVRDVALAHIKAIEVPEAGGKRFLMIAGYFTNKQIAEVIAKMSPELQKQLPTDLSQETDDLPGTDERYTFSCKQLTDILGVYFTPLAITVRDTVKSLQKLGV